MTERRHPERIGPYRILELKGEGAWGLVYLAEQQEPLRRKVAVKVLKRGVDTDEVLARFEAERQAMAMMSHPNIAQILDAGATEQGLSYFVMEYVDGEPISKYCDRYKLSVAARVELFKKVCEAVQHAHQKGIIHRDLKPSNVLVAQVEGRAVPKVIDFGIAKAMHNPLTDKTVHTVAGQFFGTPGYISPEQAQQALIGNIEVDTTTDIYALGVMLYELLTGVLPLDVRLLDVESMLKKLRETDPLQPSERLTRLGDKAEKVAEARSVDRRTLTRLLAGDLKWVLARTLEKDRTRRYQSASELAAELGRYLRNEPVLAGPPGAAYQLKKFVARHRAAAASAAMLVVLLSGFSVAMAVQVRRANRGEATAEQVSDFLMGMFEVMDPSESLGDAITAKEMLDAGVERIESELADQPIVQAELMHTMGNVYRGLGLFDQAASSLEQAVSRRERELGEDHPDLATSLDLLGVVYRAQGRYAEAEPLIERALAIREAALGLDHPDVADSQNNLAILYRREGRYAEAESLLRRTLAIQEEALGPGHPLVASIVNSLAFVYSDTGRYAEAEPLLQRALAINETVLGLDHPAVGRSLSNLARVYTDLEKYADAESLFQRALTVREATLGPDHPMLAWSLNGLADLYRRTSRFAEAEPLFERALSIRENALGPDHPDVAETLEAYAALLRQFGRGQEAEPMEERARTIRGAGSTP